MNTFYQWNLLPPYSVIDITSHAYARLNNRLYLPVYGINLQIKDEYEKMFPQGLQRCKALEEIVMTKIQI